MTNAGKFVCNVLDWSTDESPTVDRYFALFNSYDPQQWSLGSGGALFQFFCANAVHSMLVGQNVARGMCLTYSVRDTQAMNTLVDLYSVEDLEKINIMERSPDDLWVPVGSYMSPQRAWLAVEDFFRNPKQHSERVTWIAGASLPWPDE